MHWTFHNKAICGIKEKQRLIKAALFDMDGTIFDTERIYTEGWMEGARMYGYPLTEEMLVEFHGRSKEHPSHL